MKMRVARHTANLQPLIHFYHHVLGLEILGRFDGHDGYDGIFLGLANNNWHLEFTVSDNLPQHQPDEDDLLVFYPETEQAYNELKTKFAQHNISPVRAKNSYWNSNGVTYTDPDGYRMVIARPQE
ncbi:VOC family protein [Mucilaginibacter sp. PAMB04274]|uniref:VOC family protein n=1 Tax=Mucilaginibacter sp. PAMB04274 TaxID=3138568 RepID=UPI0031F63E1A